MAMARLARAAVWNRKAWNTFLKGPGVRKFFRLLTKPKILVAEGRTWPIPERQITGRGLSRNFLSLEASACYYRAGPTAVLKTMVDLKCSNNRVK